jgi:hypothetical protein
MDGHGTSPKGRCEGIPDPSEVSSLGKLSVFSISYNLIILNNIITDLEFEFFGWVLYHSFSIILVKT